MYCRLVTDKSVPDVLTETDYVLLSPENLSFILDNREKFAHKTFVVPQQLVDSRMSMRKVNKLVAYMVASGRPFGWRFIVVASNLQAVDKRIRHILEMEEDRCIDYRLRHISTPHTT